MNLSEHLGQVYDDVFDRRHPAHRDPLWVRVWVWFCRLFQH